MLISAAIVLALLPVALLPIVLWLYFQKEKPVGYWAPCVVVTTGHDDYDDQVRLAVERLLLDSDAFARELNNQDDYEALCYELGIELMENFDIKTKED